MKYRDIRISQLTRKVEDSEGIYQRQVKVNYTSKISLTQFLRPQQKDRKDDERNSSLSGKEFYSGKMTNDEQKRERQKS